MTAPGGWLPRPVTPPLYPGELGELQLEAERLWKGSTLNKLLIPLTKLPPLRPDPRPPFGRHPPSCCTVSTSGLPTCQRAEKLMERWESMPTLPSQLADSHLRNIEAAATRAHCARCHRETARMAQTEASWKWRTNGSPSPEMAEEREFVDKLSTSPPKGKRSESPKRESPTRQVNIKCDCCEHPAPKPWMFRISLGPAAQALIVDQGGGADEDKGGVAETERAEGS